MKKKFIAFGALLSTVAIALPCIAIVHNANKSFQKVKGTDPYTLTIDCSELTDSDSYTDGNHIFATDSTKALPAEQQNKVKFNFYQTAYYIDGDAYACMAQGIGWIGNDKESAIRSMSRIDITGIGNVVVSWGWYDSNLDAIVYEGSDTISAAGSEFGFHGDTPNYFKIEAPSSVAPLVKQLKIYYGRECEESVNPYYVEGGLKYYIYSNHAAVLGFSGASMATLDIPNSVQGKPVTEIAEDAFYDDDVITTVNFPDTLQFIRTCAFIWADNIEALHFPKSLRGIERSAFDGTMDCTSVTFEAGGTELMFIDMSAFASNGHVGVLTLPSRISSIGSGGGYTFTYMSNCTGFALNDDNVEGNVASVADGVLFSIQYGKKTLIAYPNLKTDTSYTVPADVRALESSDGISDNVYLEEVTFINEDTLYLDSYSMTSNDNLRRINFNGTGVVTIYWYALRYNPKLELVLPANAKINAAGLGQLGGTSTTPKNIYFLGTPEQQALWDSNWDGNYGVADDVKVLYYSESEPATTEAKLNSWHYVDGNPTAWLKQVKIVSNSTFNDAGAVFGVWAQVGAEWHLYIGEADGDNWLINVPGEVQTYVMLRLDPAGVESLPDAWPSSNVWNQSENQTTVFLQFTIQGLDGGDYHNNIYGIWA